MRHILRYQQTLTHDGRYKQRGYEFSFLSSSSIGVDTDIKIATNNMAGNISTAPLGNHINPEATFYVLVRDQKNRDPLTYNTFPWVEPKQQPKQLSFVLNRRKYCERSKCIREALEDVDSSLSDPDEPRRISTENHDPDDLGVYVRWVETENLDIPADDDDPLFPLLRLYVLADELGDYSFANILINDVMQVSRQLEHTPSKKEIWFVWEMIEEYDHPLKRLFVDYQIHEAARESLIFEEYEHISFDYLNDVALKYWDLAEQERERRQAGRDDVVFGVKCSGRGMCYYHQHGIDRNHPSCAELGF
jgi:hypothetical protein